MRIAIVADIHGNRTAFDAMLADLKQMSPDLVLHGGDLADGGSSPAYIVDSIRDFGWQGVVGNADEMLTDPGKLDRFPANALFSAIREVAAHSREELGEGRLAWLRQLPGVQLTNGSALVHASPGDCWRAPAPEASDDELERTYSSLGRPVAVYAHIHRAYVRQVGGMTIVNTGSVSLSYDGDPRAAYLLLDDRRAEIRRVSYAVEKEIEALRSASVPHADWIGKMLSRGQFEQP